MGLPDLLLTTNVNIHQRIGLSVSVTHTGDGDGPWTTYQAEIVGYDEEPDLCTIYPEDCSDRDLLTTWISAEEGSFLPLDDAV